MIYATDIPIILIKIGCQYIHVYCITYIHTLYMARRCILCPYLISYQIDVNKTLNVPQKWSVFSSRSTVKIWLEVIYELNSWHNKYFRKNIVIRFFLDMTWGNLQDIYSTKFKLRLYVSTTFVSMIYIWFIFDQIWHFYGTQICIRNVLFHGLSISVKYLTQNMPNGKICSKYIWYENRCWYMLQTLSLFLTKYAVSIFIYTALRVFRLCKWQGDVYFVHIW